MKKSLVELLLIFSLSLFLRIMIFYPSFIQGGDLGQFTTFAREISIYGGVPSTNSIYFPGTQYVYPPLVFIAAGWVSSIFTGGFEPSIAMRALLVFGALASSGTSVIIYRISRSPNSDRKNFIIALVTIFFMPDLYALSWGGDPFLVGEFLLFLLFAILLRRSGADSKWMLFSSLVIGIIALSHDLTWFFAMLSLILVLVYDFIRNGRHQAAKDLAPLVSGLAVGLVWWAPRIGFVYGAFFVSGSTGYGELSPITSAIPFLLEFVPFAIAVIAMAFYTLFRSGVKLSQVRWDPFIIALIASLIFVAFATKSTTLAGRILFFGIVLGAVVVLRLFSVSPGPKSSLNYFIRSGKHRSTLFAVILAVVIIATIPVQMSSAVGSISHYKSGYYQYDPSLLSWGQNNFTGGTVVAPNIGNYIAAFDGAPVIVYGNFLVGGTQIVQRDAGTYVVTNPASSVSLQYISQYNISYIVLPEPYIMQNSASFPPALYEQVYSDQYYTVLEYIGTK